MLQAARHNDIVAAPEVTTRQVKTAHYPRPATPEFLDFMNDLVAGYPERQIQVVLDNLNTHRAKQDRWLKRHPSVHFHFTPTYSSWPNQVGRWFGILTRQALRGASFISAQQLRQAIDDFVALTTRTPHRSNGRKPLCSLPIPNLSALIYARRYQHDVNLLGSAGLRQRFVEKIDELRAGMPRGRSALYFDSLTGGLRRIHIQPDYGCAFCSNLSRYWPVSVPAYVASDSSAM